MDKSEEIDKLASALNKAQAIMTDAKKDRCNPGAQGARYATLGSVWDAIREPLCANGLAVSQVAEPTDDSSMAITTILMHESGQWISGTMQVPLPIDERNGPNKGKIKQDPQGAGSAITYTRRYSLMAIVGVCPDDDDDGAAASRREYRNQGHQACQQEAQGAAQPPRKQPVLATKEQKEKLARAYERAGVVKEIPDGLTYKQYVDEGKALAETAAK